MDFSNFKVNKNETPIKEIKKRKQVKEKPSNLLEGQDEIVVKIVQGYSIYPKVYQGCDTCRTEVLHAIIGMKILCLGCEASYLLMDRIEYDKKINEKSIFAQEIIKIKDWCCSMLAN